MYRYLFAFALTFFLATNFDPTSVSSKVYAQNAAAAKYRSIPLNNNFKNEKSLRGLQKRKQQMLKGSDAWDDRFMKGYFQQYIAAVLTSPDQFDKVASVRDELREDRRFLTQATRGKYNGVVGNTMNAIARGNFHPSAKINALQIMSWLDQSAERRKLPVPLAGVTNLFFNNYIKKTDAPMAERIAALTGIVRHAEVAGAAWSDAQKNDRALALVNFANEQRPAEVGDEVEAILDRMVIEALSKFALENPEVHKFVAATALDNQANLFTRAVAFRQIGLIPETALASLPSEQLAIAAHDYARRSVRYIQSELAVRQVASRGSFGGNGGRPGAGGGRSGGGRGLGGGLDGGGLGDGGFGGDGFGGGQDESQRRGGAQSGGGRPGAGRSRNSNKSRVRLIDTQDAKTRVARRAMQQLLECLHVALDGTPKGEISNSQRGLMAATRDSENAREVRDLAEAVVEAQNAVNDDTVTDSSSLLTATQEAFDEIIELVIKFPGTHDFGLPKSYVKYEEAKEEMEGGKMMKDGDAMTDGDTMKEGDAMKEGDEAMMKDEDKTADANS